MSTNPFDADIMRILNNAENSDLGKLDYKLLVLATSRVGYRRKLIMFKKMFEDEIKKHTEGKEKTTTNQA